MSNFDSRRSNWFKLFAADGCSSSIFDGVPHKICLWAWENNFQLSRLEFLWTNRSLNSVVLYSFMQLKVNSANRTLYILSRLSHRVCGKTSAVLMSHDSPYTVRPALACNFSRLLKCVLYHDPQRIRP